jgi:hypothetical protein
MNHLINETVQLRRERGYSYWIVDPQILYRQSAWLALPQHSYIYPARINNLIQTLVQVPTEFLLTHAAAIIGRLC